jgi:flagellar hook-associated protein 3 FlgL
MRISSTVFFETGLNSITAQQSDLLHIYQQVSTGKRMVTPSDDPLAASQAINISQAQSLNQRFSENREVAKRNLGLSESTLDNTVLLLQDIKTRLVEASNGTLSDSDRSTLAGVFSDARDSLLGLANATDGNGQFLFSGAKGNTAAFQDINGKIEYMGDQGARRIQADQTRQIIASDVGSQIFARATPGTTDYVTRAGTNTGNGFASNPAITDPSGANIGNVFEVTFTSPDRYSVVVKDPLGATVQTVTNQVYNADVSKSLALPGGVQIQFTGQPAINDTFFVEPAHMPDMLASAGVQTGTGSISSPLVSDYSIYNATYSYDIEFTALNEYTVVMKDSANNPVETLTNQTFVPGRENVLSLPGGVQVKVSGNPAVNDTFSVVPTDDTIKTDLNIFDTLDSVIEALRTPSNGNPAASAYVQNTLASAMQRIDINYNNVITVRASVGARMNELDSLDANGSQRALNYSQELSRLEDLDYYTATTQLQLRTAALEAASLAFKKIQNTSLFNMGSN